MRRTFNLGLSEVPFAGTSGDTLVFWLLKISCTCYLFFSAFNTQFDWFAWTYFDFIGPKKNEPVAVLLHQRAPCGGAGLGNGCRRSLVSSGETTLRFRVSHLFFLSSGTRTLAENSLVSPSFEHLEDGLHVRPYLASSVVCVVAQKVSRVKRGHYGNFQGPVNITRPRAPETRNPLPSPD